VPYDGDGVLTVEKIVTLGGSKAVGVTPQTGWVHL
jgi:hypothetical protein